MSKNTTITRSAAIAIFVALNFKTADKWPDDRLNKRISQLADNVDADAVNSIDDATVKADLKNVLKSLEAGDTVTVAVEETAKKEKLAKAEKPASEEAPAEKPKKAAKAEQEPAEPAKKEKPAKAEKPKASKEEPAKDKWGNREGSQAAQINAQLSKKWATVEAVAEATKLSAARVRSHFKYLEGKKLIELSDEKGARAV